MSSHEHNNTSLNINIHDHFTRVIHPNLNKRSKFFSQRYFQDKGYFFRKHDQLSAEAKLFKHEHPQSRITSFQGGNVHFPYEDRQEVLKHIAYDIQTESAIYWNQRAFDVEKEGTRLVIDLDSDNRIIQDNEICQISRVLWQTLKAYFTNFAEQPIDIFVAKCGPRVKKGNLSVGVHIIAHVKVSIPQAKQIIFGFGLRLKKTLHIDMTGIEVDDKIYRENNNSCSLRMIYCHKIEPCPLCKDRRDQRMQCDFCQRDGCVISKSTYEPRFALNPTTGRSDEQYFRSKNSGFFQIVKNYSIWPDSPTEYRDDYERPKGDCLYTLEEKYQLEQKNARKRKREGKLTKAEKKQKRVHRDETHHQVYDMLEEYLHQLEWKGNTWWDGIVVDEINLTSKSRLAWVKVSGQGCTMCPYAMKDHGTNKIYFKISCSGTLQFCCYSEKHGCKTKDPIKMELPGYLIQKLFDLKGPPSLYPPRDTGVFNMNKFINAYPKSGLHESNKKTKKQLAREKHLARLTQAYANL